MSDYRGDRAAVWVVCVWIFTLVCMFVAVLA